jgi:glycerol-3-phosphate dehydrogenase
VSFLRSMGLAPEMYAVSAEQEPKGMIERAIWRLGGLWAGASKARTSVEYSRAQFEAGEVDALRHAFEKRAVGVVVRDGDGDVAEVRRIKKEELVELLKEVPGYEDTPVKDCEYVLEEAGFATRVDMDFDEFVEASGFIYLLFDKRI